VIQQHGQLQKVFPFWRAIEALTPQKLDKDNPDDNFNPAYKIGFNGVLPWRDPKHSCKRIPHNKVWRYTAQVGVYDLSPLSQLLQAKIGSHEEVFEDRTGSKSRLFDISFDEFGIPKYESFMLSLPAWAAGQILMCDNSVLSLEQSASADLTDLSLPNDFIPQIDSGFSDFDELTRRLMQWVACEAFRFSRENITADLSWLIRLANIVISKTNFPVSAMNDYQSCLIKCHQIKAEQQKEKIEQVKKVSISERGKQVGKNATSKKPVALPDDMLNSFFIRELSRLNSAWHQNDFGVGFSEYMGAISDPERKRVDIRSSHGLKIAFQGLLPTQAPAGAWPSQYPLAFSQQLAINEIWHRHSESYGIFAVNGPPGTGKTTLLRDIVAAVVTQRAQRLVNHIDNVFSAKKTIKLGDSWIPYYSLREAVKGFSIVVASANNGAVENISLELPGEDAVPETILGQSDYFSDLASELIGKPGWGLLAAKLGNKGNRDDFMNVFWWRKPEEDKKEDENDDSLMPDSFTPKRGEGLLYHLSMIKDGRRSPTIQWCDAVLRFKNALRMETMTRERLVGYSNLSAKITTIRHHIQETEVAGIPISTKLKQFRAENAQVSKILLQFEDALKNNLCNLEGAEKRLKQQESNKPGFLAWIATLGRSHRDWWERYHLLTRESDALRGEINSQQQQITYHKSKMDKVHREIYELESELCAINRSLANHKENLNSTLFLLEQAKVTMGNHWPDPEAPDDVRERSAPWAHEDWRKAREALFLAALDVHRSFIENNPSQIISNINLVSDWLQGKDLPEEVAATALDSLCLIVPVISTTFASIPRMFKKIGKEAIGWLLIDEAGQALPQQAAGAIWRAARTVVVGDPKQLEPVSGIPATVEGALAQHYSVHPSWWPSKVSAQVLADQTMGLGTHLPTPDNGKVWVGCPLRVHRRCDDPMFSVSNKIAYDGLMVHGKKEIQSHLPKSGWINVVGKNSEGNWIIEEGEAVKKLLIELRSSYGILPANIFLISPFVDCAKQLSRLAAQLGFDTQKTGTVHTTQGKEANVVVLVLGGNPQNPGARGWAASRPNLLNVAVSRAKQRLYVIGDRSEWKKQRYFSTLVQYLPEMQVGGGGN